MITDQIDYAKATKHQLWKVLKDIEQAQLAEPETPQGDLCQGDCEPNAMKYLRADGRGNYELRPFGSRDIPYYVRGPLAVHCPFCGRRLKDV